jgi:hypothetical protein
VEQRLRDANTDCRCCAHDTWRHGGRQPAACLWAQCWAMSKGGCICKAGSHQGHSNAEGHAAGVQTHGGGRIVVHFIIRLVCSRTRGN